MDICTEALVKATPTAASGLAARFLMARAQAHNNRVMLPEALADAEAAAGLDLSNPACLLLIAEVRACTHALSRSL